MDEGTAGEPLSFPEVWKRKVYRSQIGSDGVGEKTRERKRKLRRESWSELGRCRVCGGRSGQMRCEQKIMGC